ncbi:polymorphic toxin-type HINT domain-containing protein [Kitasatospora indigofera]|uniref:TreTu family toxin n=1 Tax=Kitasatospora indigofera TaxID=67307 RepID=UPI00364A9A60
MPISKKIRPPIGLRGRIAGPLGLAVIATLLGPVAAQAAAASPDFSRVWEPPNTPLPGTASVKAKDTAKPQETAPHAPVPRPANTDPARTQVSQGSAIADLAAAGPGAAARAGTLPIWVSTPPGQADSTAAHSSSADTVTVVQSETKTADAAGVEGLLFSLTATPATAKDSSSPPPDVKTSSVAPVKVAVDVDALNVQTDGDFASRGRLVTLPACALTTPQVPSCLARTPVATQYDSATKRLTANVDLPLAATPLATTGAVKASFSSTSLAAPAVAPASAPAVLLAAETGASGGGGTYSATNLTASSGWNAGGSSGAMTYSYDAQVPPALGGSAPAVSLGYNSASVDGKTSATNSQASWVGDGWDFNPGFIERTYKPCDKDGITGSGDLCWGGYNATLSLGSHSGQLVRVNDGAAASDDATGVWRIKGDDGTKVEFGTGASNGTDNGAYAKVTDTSGTVYYFGLNHLPGGDKSDPATNSASTVPVYSPNAGDRCYDSAKGKASWCQMWQRLSLDYVVDAHGNLTTFTWAPEANWYSRGGGQNNGNGTLSSYTRATTLSRIDYGQRLSEQVAAKGALQPAARVSFTVAERCLAAGTTCDIANRTVANKNNWPDVPVDQECQSTATCTNYGPTFFTTKRLTTIATQVRVNNAWQDVDTYALTHSFPDPNDTTSQKALWLDSVQRTGKTAAPNITTPPVSFVPVMLPNRVDGTDLVPAPPLMNRPRIQQIKNETGGVLNVDYNLPGCSRINNVMPAAEDDNTKACYPVRWLPAGSVAGADPVLDWFNHYTVASLTENDFATGSPAKITSYAYGPAGWHRDDNEYTDTKARTWGDFRGFATVTVTTGDGNDGPKGQSRTTYRQGMDGDARKDGGTRTVHLTDALGRDITDVDHLAGQVLQTETFDQAGGTVVAQSVNNSSGPVTTATHIRGSGLPDLTAHYTATTTTSTARARKSDGTWRTTTSTTTTDPAHGNRLVTSLDQADGLPDLCTRSTYATGPDPQRIDQIAEKLTVSGAGACSATPTTANTVARDIVLYDGQPYGQAGATADPTNKQTLDHYDGTGAPVFVPIASSLYDTYGRTVSATDPNSTDAQHPNGSTTTVSYTQAGAGELPTVVTTSAPTPGAASGTWDTVTTLDSRRSLPLTVKDLNNKTAAETYDALGRLTGVWAPGRTPASKPNANQKFTYSISNQTGVPSTVTTSKLMADGSTPVYMRQVALLDGFARTRQTQSTPPTSSYEGRMVTDTLYDSQGRTRAANAAWYNGDSAPSGSLVTAVDSTIPAQSRTTFDGLSRPVTSTMWSLGVQQTQTTTAYPGVDRTDVVPPPGSWPVSTLTDARGRTSELWQYNTPTATGQATNATVTRYSYTPGGQAAGRVDAAGNTWNYGYDQRGRRTSASDPDTGTSTLTYDGASRLDTSTNAKGEVLKYTYDLAGRKTSLYSGSVSAANQLAGWTYDTVLKGQPASSTRYVGGSTGQAYTSAVTGYDNGYRPTGSTITIPGTEVGQASGTYAYSTSSDFNPITGNAYSTTLPALGGAPVEIINYSYNKYGQLFHSGGATTYDVLSDYDAFGRPIRSTVNPWGTQVVSSTVYDQATGRVRSQFLDQQTSTTGAIQQTNYTYNPSGAITSITDIPDNTPSATDRQCFTYDTFGRLTTAWTDTGTITTPDPLQHKTLDQAACTNTTPTSGAMAPAKTTVGGANPYWQDYTYDLTGNRTTLVEHDQYGDTTKDVTTTQAFGTPGARNTPTAAANTGGGTGGPHALLTSTVKTGASTSAGGASQYDAAGNTTSARSGRSGSGTATLSWNSEGKLASYTVPAQITGNGGTCIATAGGSSANGTNLQINNCSTDGSQLYATANNTLSTLGKCAQAMGTTTGAAVQLQACDKSAAQTWIPRSDKTLYNPASGRCLAVPGDVTTSSTALSLGDCATTVPAGQKWTIPNTTTTYLYDADGNQLIRRNPDKTTINLGADELTLDTSTKANQTGTRYYPIPGGMTIVRTGAGTAPGTFVVQNADHHGSNTIGVDLNTGAINRRPNDPFGNPRGTQPAPGTWASDKGFVGGTKDDTTKLTNLGARQYDPTTGRFISPDPLLAADDPQQWNGYAYSDNDPVNLSDPSGLITDTMDKPCSSACVQANTETINKANAETAEYFAPENILKRHVTGTKLPDATFAIFQGPTYGYTGSQDFTIGEALDWVKTGGDGAWDAVCYLAGNTTDFCKSNPFTGNPDIYADHTGELAGAALLVGGAVIAALPCAEGWVVCAEAILSGELAFASGGSAIIGTSAAMEVAGARALFGKKFGCNSFLAGTQVLLADGTTKSIEEIEPGDRVVATDPKNGVTADETVIATITRPDDQDFTDLTLSKAGQAATTQILTSTQHHPYWEVTAQKWIDATDLNPGDEVLTTDGTTLNVTKVRNYQTSPRPAYNLTIAQLHTYYVLAGEIPILVHNSDPTIPTPDPGNVTVGRWMGADEYQKMLKTGRVQPGGGGFSYVVYPSDPNAYISSRPGSVYVEFDVPQSLLIPGGRPGDFKMSDSSTIFSRLAVQRGGAPLELPEAKNMRLGGGTICP